MTFGQVIYPLQWYLAFLLCILEMQLEEKRNFSGAWENHRGLEVFAIFVVDDRSIGLRVWGGRFVD